MQSLPVWSVGSCQNRIKLTINHSLVSGDLTSFPVYINLTLLPASFWTSVQNGGGDIRITTSDGLTEIAREIVTCNTATRAGEVHALVPSVSTTVDTDIYIYFGNSTASDYAANATYGSQAVWTAFKLVQHMQTNANDSTSNANNGTLIGTTQTAASIGNGRSFGASGTDKSTHTNAAGQIFNNTDMTLHYRVKRTSTALIAYLFSHPETAGNGNRLYLNWAANDRLNLVLGAGGQSEASASITDTTTYHDIIALYERSTRKVKLYVDGIVRFDFIASSGVTPTSTLQSLFVGNQGSAAVQSSAAIIDEVRVQPSLATDAFIVTEHNNLNNPISFLVIGSIESHQSNYTQLMTADLRQIGRQIYMDFAKAYNPALAGTQYWDKYAYTDYSDRLLSLEWSREEVEYSSVAMASADFVFDNHDDFFTPNGDSPIVTQLLDNRPVKIYAGFGTELLQEFVGLTDGLPKIDDERKTATFHVIDFMSMLMRRSLDESTVFVNQRTDQILRTLLNNEGLLDAQISLSIGLNIVRYAYSMKGQILGDILYKLMEAEGGRFFMSESGVLTFKNRQDYSSIPVQYFSPNEIVDSIPVKSNEILNVVQIKGLIREVQPKQPYGQLSSITAIPANGIVDVWINFDSPVTSADDPVFVDLAQTSYFVTNTGSDGLGVPINTNVNVTTELFDTSMVLHFSNTNAFYVYVTNVVIFATPAFEKQNFYVRSEDEDSVLRNGERILDINNDFFGSDSEAASKAAIILRTFATIGDIRRFQVKANPALQLGDPVRIDLFGINQTQRIIKISSKISPKGVYLQILTTAKLLGVDNYFTIGLSAIGGADLVAP